MGKAPMCVLVKATWMEAPARRKGAPEARHRNDAKCHLDRLIKKWSRYLRLGNDLKRFEKHFGPVVTIILPWNVLGVEFKMD